MIGLAAADGPEVQALWEELAATYRDRYGSGDLSDVTPAQVRPPEGACLVAYRDGMPVGTVSYRRMDEATAHVVRLYVRPQARGAMVAGRLMRRALLEARAAGYRRMVADTGVEHPEVIAAAVGFGAVPVSPFGRFADAPTVRCFALDLD